MIYFTADTHFYHKNVIRYSERPFLSIEEHNNTIVKNWNKIVGKKDKVYFLGDLAFCSQKIAIDIVKSLNGEVHFFKGNHDRTAYQIRMHFASFQDVKMIRINEYQLWLSHYRHLVWPQKHYGAFHLYGHSHGRVGHVYDKLLFDVGVDCWNYTPVSFDRILELSKWQEDYNI